MAGREEYARQHTMKLHLNLLLRRYVLAAMASIACYTVNTADAGQMHSDVEVMTYTDFGQNKGRYVTGSAVNALLQHIRTQEGGIAIHYTDGTAPYYISNAQGMISFAGTGDNGAYTAIAPNAMATVLHNGSNNASYAERVVGADHAINYSAIDIVGSSVFRLAPPQANGELYDYMLQRQSKIVTDAVYNPLSGVTDVSVFNGQYQYHSGSGKLGMYVEGSGYQGLAGAYTYIIGGINQIKEVWNGDGNHSVITNPSYGNGIGADLTNPLPNGIQGGDSGSPGFIYNSNTGQYEYITAQQSGYQSGGDGWGQARGNVEWTQETLESFNARVTMGPSTSTVYLNAINTSEGEVSDGSNTATLYSGSVTDAAGNVLVKHNGVRHGLNTWNDLSALKDTQKWYAYDANGYLSQSDANLFFTNNLVFTTTAPENSIVLKDTVDLGIGYAEFNGGKFTITSENGEVNRFNHAGYVINEGAEVHLRLTNPSNHMTEWRKSGAGDLYIEGTGDTNALLNVGGSGRIYLQQTNGYAAYNVLANTGATVVIKDVDQIKRDFTFGAGGGVLEMNGNSMNWYTSNGDTPRNGCFTINALTDEAVIANSSGASVLTYKETGNNTYLGSFQDSATGSLRIDYQGAGTWTLNSIHTDLSRHEDSGLTVSSGTVVLVGTNTVHGRGSASGTNTNRLTRWNDWHYADAAMNVNVADGAMFELGSHARLTGNVTVEQGGIYVMREGVQHSQEYVEGGQLLEDTSKYAAYYGHKGNTSLANGATLQISFSEGTTATNTYAGNITGAGNVSVDAAQGVLLLGGENTFTGTKTLTSGGLIGTSAGALGDTSSNKWVMGREAWIASHAATAAELLSQVDTSSTGTLVISSAMTTRLDMTGYEHLYLGAEDGLTVQYGTFGTSEELNAVNGAWRLGGGGGTLVVNYVLSGANDVMLGASESSQGYVHLTNSANDFSGRVVFSGTGIVLSYEEGALGSASVVLEYGNSLHLRNEGTMQHVDKASQGMVMVDGMETTGSIALDNHPGLTLGASQDVRFNGAISVAADQAYRLGAINGATLTLTSTLDSGHDIEVDAQGGTGGRVVLANTSVLGGNVIVQGNKTAGAAGDITLVLGQDTTASGTVTLRNGGSLDLAGNMLTLQGALDGSGTLRDSSAEADASLVLDSGAETRNIAANLQVGNITKNGSGTLNLSSTENRWNQFRIDEGTVKLLSNNALAENGTTYVGSGACLDMNTPDNTSSGGNNMRVTNGRIVLEDGATLHTGSTATDDFSLLTGSLCVAAGSTASITGNHLRLSAAANNAGGGTIALNLTSLRLNETYAQYIGGTVAIQKSMELHSGGSATDMLKQFDHLQVNNGVTLNVHDQTWNTIWRFDKLTGEGDIIWHSDTTHDSTARMILGGEGNYSGTISVNRSFDAAARRYQAYLQVDSERAISGATVNLNGSHTNDNISLAVNADRVQMAGLNGNANSHILAGAALANSAMTSAPSSSRKSTLVLGGSGNYTFSGTVGHANDTLDQCISLEMKGSGTQTFVGSSVVVGNVTALQGTLNIAPGSGNYPTILGDVSVAQGATLQLGSSYSLNAGHTLNVLAGAEGTSAVLSSNLVMNGGVLSFSDYDAEHASLSTNSVSFGERADAVNLLFSNLRTVEQGVSYLLVNGDWSSCNDINVTLQDYRFYQAVMNAGTSGLRVSFELADDSVCWEGPSTVLTQDSLVIFTEENNIHAAELAGGTSVEGGFFLNDSDYTLSASDGGSISFGSMEKYGSGRVILNADVNAGSLQVVDACVIDGQGTVTIGHLTLMDDLQTRNAISLNTLTVENNAGWTMTGNEGAGFVQILTNAQLHALGDVRVDGTATLQLSDTGDITVTKQVTGTGGVAKTGSGKLTLNADWAVSRVNIDGGTISTSVTLDWDTLQMASGSRLELTHTSGTTEIGSILGAGSLEKTTAGNLVLGDAQLASAVVKGGGETTISGAVSLSSKLDIGTEKVTLVDGANVTTTQLRMGTTANNQNAYLSIESGATLNISGTTITDADKQDGSNSLLLAHWRNAASTLVLDGGTLNAGGASMHMGWDSSGTFEALSGEADLKGILFSTARDNADSFILGSETGGSVRVNIGSGGITGFRANDNVLLGNGTIAATASFSITGNGGVVNLVGKDSGTIFDTAGHTITVNAVMQGDGKLVVNGSGTLKLAHASGVTDIAELSCAGNFEKDGAGDLKLHQASLADVILKGNGETTISGKVDVSGQLSIGRGTVHIQEGAVVSVNRLTAGDQGDNSPSVININGGELKVTGALNDNGTGNSILLAHWMESASVLTLNSGKLVAEGAVLNAAWNTGGTFRALGGEAELLGINLKGQIEGRSGSFVLGSENEGDAVVRLGAKGIKGIVGTASMTLGNGTLEAAADFSIEGSNAVSLVGINTGTIFDTNGYTVTLSSALSGDGTLVKSGSGTLLLTRASSSYAGTILVNEGVLSTATNGALGTSAVVINGGVLEMSPVVGPYENASIQKNTVTVNDGGTLRIGGNNNKVVDKDVVINAGGRMEFIGTGSDMIDYSGECSKTITVDGGVLDFGTTRQTMANTALVLKNGAHVIGGGASYGASFTAALDYHEPSTIVAEGEGNIIDSNVRIRNVKLTFEVKDDSELVLNGRMHYDTDAGQSIVVEKTGAGRMEVSSLVKLATLNLKDGELVLTHTGGQNELGTLEASQGGTLKSTLKLAQDVELKVAGKIYGCSTSAVELETGAQLVSTEDGVIITHGGGTGNARMECNTAREEYSVDNANFEMTNVHLKYDSSMERTLSNKLTNSTIENMNAGARILTVDNRANTLNGVVASKGDINVLNQAALSLDLLEVATGRSVAVHTGADVGTAEAAVAVNSTAVFGSGASLSIASLTLGDGVTLEMTDTSSAVKLNGASLTFGGSLVLGDNLLADVLALDCGETLSLFTEVGGFSMPVGASTELESTRVLASSVFSNVQSENLYVAFRVVDNVGTLLVMSVPEPATTTLSLLALTALAARRRRKQ